MSVAYLCCLAEDEVDGANDQGLCVDLGSRLGEHGVWNDQSLLTMK